MANVPVDSFCAILQFNNYNFFLMKKKKGTRTIALAVQNLARFFHYHEGEGRELAIKIGASFMACVSLLIITGAYRIEQIFAERSYVLSMLVPELAEPAIAYQGETFLLAMEDPGTTSSRTEVTTPQAPSESVPTPPPAPAENTDASQPKPLPPQEQPQPQPQPQLSDKPQEQPQDKPQENGESGPNEEWELQNAINDRKNVLREMRDQKRELQRTCAQLKRLKNVTTELAACTDLAAKVAEWEGKIKSWNGSFSQELRDLMDDYRELQVWEELEILRLKANLPRELNQFFRDYLRVEKLLKQKSFQKITWLDWPAITAKFGEIKALHAEAKACYEASDLQCASEKLNEARETNYPGELEGSLHMLRGLNDMLRQVKDPDVKTEVQSLLQPAIDSINTGEWRDGRQEIESFNQELNQFLQYIVRAQQRKRKAPDDTMQRLEKLLDKYGGGKGKPPHDN